ncbi:hypothetical protein [Mycolicibacterium moriokaense]|uniref:DUF732 domain-containing protein n=1 Tax=Mycolicibacterium moriokaense TaxID=39691 RepID=A0A318H8N3_9MYCO|nr:hypothetical protein [Mycolicibacterium moriokaense]PXX01576.1 hypothetical protein C8E89_12862 [Mycolicibacterium moriokaense]
MSRIVCTPKPVAVLATVLVAVVSSGCGSQSGPAAPPGASAPSAGAPAGGAGNCPAAAAAVAAALKSTPEVTDTSVIECAELAVSTSLTTDPAGKASALAICEKAAEIAYANGLSGLFVQSIDKKQLASGAKGLAGCLQKP